MKKRIIQLTALALTAFVGVAQAAIVTVTKPDGFSGVATGDTGTFYWAITNAAAGDTIK